MWGEFEGIIVHVCWIWAFQLIFGSFLITRCLSKGRKLALQAVSRPQKQILVVSKQLLFPFELSFYSTLVDLIASLQFLNCKHKLLFSLFSKLAPR